MKKADAIAAGLLLFPFSVAALSMAGFAAGLPIGLWQMPVALAISVFSQWRLAGGGSLRAAVWTLGLVAAAFAICGLSVSYTVADAASYHRPATILLANGWNPLRLTEVEEIKDLMGGGFRPWHVAFLPRLAWIFGAACYRWFGFVEIADSFNLIILFASFLSVSTWLDERFGIVRWKRILLTAALCLSPHVLVGLFGGALDAGGYAAFVCAIVAADRRNMLQLALSIVIMAGLKFTGAVFGALVFGVFALFDIGAFKKWAAAGIVTGILVLLVNATPYLTSIRHHGGPFYPSHSFVAAERFADEKNPITYDFGYMNDDAKEMGYLARFSWAYVSQGLVRWHYRHGSGRENFNPVFNVNGGVGGFGPFFRVLFVLSLIGWAFVRNRSIHAMLAVILLSVLVQPTFYSGYARYVPQFYLFPFLVALGVMERIKPTSCGKVFEGALAGVLGAFTASALAYPASFFALQWIISVQNLQIASAAQTDSHVQIVASSLYCRTALGTDIGIEKERIHANVPEEPFPGLREYHSYFNYGSCYLQGEIEGFYELSHVVSMDDPSVKASRNANNARFFLKEFLSGEILKLPVRWVEILCLRAKQFLPA